MNPHCSFTVPACKPSGRGLGTVFLIAIVAALLAYPHALSGQEGSGRIHGRVLNSQGSPVGDVTVTARNMGSGAELSSRTGQDGRFEITGAAAGAYEVRAEMGGNNAALRRDLRTGEQAAVELTLGDDAASQNLAGQGADRAAASSVQQIDATQLSGLPLNGRSYNQLATLQAGVTETSNTSASRGIGGGSLTIAGGRPTSNNFLLDGTNIMDANNQVPRSAGGVQLGSDAVYEVQVFSSYYGPEYGRGAGGIVNSITHSGTPEFHGTAFEYLRNSKLDARNFFDPEAEPPPFKRNQFGFTLTGPVHKDTTYFLGSLEALRDRLSETQLDHFPDTAARAGFLPGTNGELRRIDFHPAIPQYLETIYPSPNSTELGGGIAEHRSTVFLPTNEIFFTTRLDHKISEQDSVFGRYTFDDAESFNTGDSALYQIKSTSRQQYATLVGTHIFNLAALTAVRIGFTRAALFRDSVTDLVIPPELYLVPGAFKMGLIEVSGLSTVGPGTQHPDFAIANTFQFANDTVVQRGRHALKWGFQAHRYRWDTDSNNTIGGEFDFNSLESFLQGGPTGTSAAAALPGSDKAHAYRQTMVGLYFQDTFAFRPNLQLSLGLRYEYTSLIYDKNGNTAKIPDLWHELEAVRGELMEHNPSGKDFAPRIGITWSPGSRGTVIGLGFGIYHDPIMRYALFGRDASAPYYNRGLRTNFDSTSVFPNAAEAVKNEPNDGKAIDYYHPHVPITFRYTASLQQEFPGDWRMQATYVGARGNHLLRGYEGTQFPEPIRQADGTWFFPPDTPFVNPNFSGVGFTSMDGQSFFNALQLSGGRRIGGGISVQASYSFSKSVDDASAPSQQSTQYGFDRALGRGLSNFDVRHRVSFNYFYPLPFGGGQRWWNSGVLGRVFGGWRIGGIFSLRSGTPFTPTVSVRTPGYLYSGTQPNLVAGRSNNPISGVSAGCNDPRTGLTAIAAGQPLGGPALYFDPCSFSVPQSGTLGNAGRNTLVAPWVFNADVSVQREFVVDSKRRLQFRAEIFNVPNRANFGEALSGVFSGAYPGRPNPTAGRINETVTTSRQIQFALRFSF